MQTNAMSTWNDSQFFQLTQNRGNFIQIFLSEIKTYIENVLEKSLFVEVDQFDQEHALHHAYFLLKTMASDKFREDNNSAYRDEELRKKCFTKRPEELYEIAPFFMNKVKIFLLELRKSTYKKIDAYNADYLRSINSMTELVTPLNKLSEQVERNTQQLAKMLETQAKLSPTDKSNEARIDKFFKRGQI
jgi:hypothetical protein